MDLRTRTYRYLLFVIFFPAGSVVNPDPVDRLKKKTITAWGFYKRKQKLSFHTKTTCWIDK
jgi:hypothetical protein